MIRISRSSELKLKIVQEAFSPGASVSSTAAKHRVAKSMIYKWREAFVKNGYDIGVRHLHTQVCSVPNRQHPNVAKPTMTIGSLSETVTFQFGSLMIEGPLRDVVSAVNILEGNK